MDKICELALGGYGEAKAKTTFYIRLICPFEFGQKQVEKLYAEAVHSAENTISSPCAWELATGIQSSDSFLGYVRLGGMDGMEYCLDRVLYPGKEKQEPYLFFRLKDCHLQVFKELVYNPSQKYPVTIRLSACDFIPFQNGTGFLCVAFECVENEKKSALRDAFDLNYYLPFISYNHFPLAVPRKEGLVVRESREFYISGLFEKAKQSLTEGSQKLAELWDQGIELQTTDNRPWLFFMAYAVLGVSEEEWESDLVQDACQFYHQVTRWSPDAYQHSVSAQVQGHSPETLKTGSKATRTYEFRDRGVTCIGLGASKFECANFLPKFRESYLFALTLAWDIYLNVHCSKKGVAISPELSRAIQNLVSAKIFTQSPRQEFFEDCLRFWLGANYILEVRQCLQSIPSLQQPDKPVSNDMPKSSENCIFRPCGDFWEVVYMGNKAQSKNTLGMHYIHHLLSHPQKAFNCRELSQICAKADNALYRKKSQEISSENNYQCVDRNLGEICDSEAMADYKNHLSEIEEELELAKKNTDLGRQSALEEEKEQLMNEIRSARCARKTVSPEKEKARKRVCNAIQKVIQNIGKRIPDIESFLLKNIETGWECSYKGSIVWEV